MEYFVGLDLGQVQDHTAVAVVTLDSLYKEVLAFNEEVRRRPYMNVQPIDVPEPTYEVVYLERLPLGTPYPRVTERVCHLLGTPPLRDRSILAVDATGVGAPLVDMLREAGLHFMSVVITAGDKETQEDRTHRVPKRNLIALPQVLLQTKRLKIAPTLPEAKTLTEELRDFRYEIRESANEAYGSWREGDHDDLVLAVALAVWAAERRSPPVSAQPVTNTHLPFPPLKRPLF